VANKPGTRQIRETGTDPSVELTSHISAMSFFFFFFSHIKIFIINDIR